VTQLDGGGTSETDAEVFASSRNLTVAQLLAKSEWLQRQSGVARDYARRASDRLDGVREQNLRLCRPRLVRLRAD
jgi:hypothetical protein